MMDSKLDMMTQLCVHDAIFFFGIWLICKVFMCLLIGILIEKWTKENYLKCAC